MDRRRMAKAAAVLTAHLGANKAQLIQDVRKVGNYGEGGLSGRQVGRIVRQSLAEDYVTAHRFQNRSAHNRPQLEAPTGLEMAQQWGRSVARPGSDRSMLDLPRKAADHTYGQNRSQFVSLTGDVEGLHHSPDDWAQRITRGARQLHEYTIPRRLVRDSARLVEDIGISARTARSRTGWLNLPKMAETMRKTWSDDTRTTWLRGTPAQESEVLYMGGDLGKYRTSNVRNPYRR